MANYRYRAQGADGKIVSGKLPANSEQDLHNKLRDTGLMLLDYKSSEKSKRYKALKSKALADYSRQIGTLLRAGVSLVKALQIMSEDESVTEYERSVYREVTTYVIQGVPLSDSMRNLPGVFPPLIINMYKAAEESGKLDATALRMADQYTREERLNAKIKSAMTYPKILGVLIIVVVAIIFGFVLPQFKPMFDQMDSLPFTTKVMMAISSFVGKYWYTLFIAAAVIWLLIYFLKKIPIVVYYFDKFKIRAPKIGKLFKIIYTARFARTLNSLYSSGIPIVTCLSIAKTTIGNKYIESQFDDVIASVQAGNTLTVSLQDVDGFINKLTSSINVGEEAGSLDSMLASIAEDLEFESDKAITQMVAYIEPVMIVVMAAVVGFIILSVITPIYQSYQTIGSS